MNDRSLHLPVASFISLRRLAIVCFAAIALSHAALPALPVMAQPANRAERLQERQERREQKGERPDPLDKAQPNRKNIIERIKQLRVWKLTERLKMTTEQSEKFFPRYNGYQNEIAANLERMQTGFAELQQMQVGSATDADIDKRVQQLLEIQKGNTELLQKYIKEFREVLSARQAAELVIFERDFLRDISKLMEAARQKQEQNK